jgi:hypothetical protein
MISVRRTRMVRPKRRGVVQSYRSEGLSELSGFRDLGRVFRCTRCSRGHFEIHNLGNGSHLNSLSAETRIEFCRLAISPREAYHRQLI